MYNSNNFFQNEFSPIFLLESICIQNFQEWIAFSNICILVENSIQLTNGYSCPNKFNLIVTYLNVSHIHYFHKRYNGYKLFYNIPPLTVILRITYYSGYGNKFPCQRIHLSTAVHSEMRACVFYTAIFLKSL